MEDIFLILINLIFGILNFYLAFSIEGFAIMQLANIIIGTLNFGVVGWGLAGLKYGF